ncbi:restriction endonuclease subunit S [Psychrobacter celer]|uniref:restriction endonuclease subunit S n=1 Tax=Psychrobacter celer TaxID=306572 RepID=UPI003FD0198D
MVPNGWEEKRLGKVAEFQRGFDLPSAKRLDGNIPIISSSGVSGFHNESKVKAPGIVTGRYGTIGNVFLIDEDFWPLNTSLWVKDFHQNEIKFIYYLLQSFDFKKFSDKTGVPGVNRNDLHAVKVKVPPLPEQQKIAKILTTWDKAISTTERLIDNSKQQKKALMQQLLTGKKRLLDDNGNPFEGEWKSSNFSKVFEVANNKNSQVKSSDYLESGTIPIVDQGKKLVSGYTNKQDIYSDTPVIIFGDHTRVVKWVDFNFCQGADGTQVLKPNSILETKFAYYLLSHTPIPNLGYSRHMRELKEKSFKYPIDKLEQQKIAAVLTTADKEIELLEQQLADLQQEKKALMQVLLTGKKRVRIDEIV